MALAVVMCPGWKLVTDAVHAKGTPIFLQIWHAGRAAHPGLNEGKETVSASAIAIDGETHTLTGKERHVVPRELSDDEVPSIVEAFRLGGQSPRP